MSANDNSVNIKPSKRGYHHGDLRLSVIEVGHRLLEQGNAETLSLREIARDVGVSATAIYRHFPDKGALLSALAADGLRKLADQQARATSKAPNKMEGFAASGQAYVRFAIANPALFRLIFSYLPTDAHPSEISPEGSAAWMLRRDIGALLGPATPDTVKFATAMRAWALVHGLAMLILDHQIDSSIADDLISQVVSSNSLNLRD